MHTTEIETQDQLEGEGMRGGEAKRVLQYVAGFYNVLQEAVGSATKRPGCTAPHDDYAPTLTTSFHASITCFHAYTHGRASVNIYIHNRIEKEIG